MKIQIVDDNDEIIGTKERSELDHSIDIYRVAALWLTNSKGETLLAKRSANKDKDPNKWGPAVAGTVDEGETYEQNIYKEAIEEIGLDGVVFTRGPKMRVTEPRNYFCQWYFAQLDREASEFTKQDDEVAELSWVNINELKKDLETNPDKCVPAMPRIVKEFCNV